MPLSQLDAHAALVVIDLQKGIVALPSVHPMTDVIANVAALARAFRARGLPVVLVVADAVAPGRTEAPSRARQFPPGFDELLEELDPQPSDIRVAKQTWGVFATTDLEAQLKTLGVTQVVVTGVATTFGVESTARQAYEAGFNVTLALDAMADLSAEAHERAITLVFPRLGETGSTADILALLPPSNATEA